MTIELSDCVVFTKLFYVDIEVYDTSENSFAQAKYLVHGYEDVLWTDDLYSALMFLQKQIKIANAEIKKNKENKNEK